MGKGVVVGQRGRDGVADAWHSSSGEPRVTGCARADRLCGSGCVQAMKLGQGFCRSNSIG